MMNRGERLDQAWVRWAWQVDARSPHGSPLLKQNPGLKEEELSIIEYQSKNGLIKVSDYINEKINLNEAKINLLNQQINLLLIQKKLKILTGETQ